MNQSKICKSKIYMKKIKRRMSDVKDTPMSLPRRCYFVARACRRMLKIAVATQHRPTSAR